MGIKGSGNETVIKLSRDLLFPGKDKVVASWFTGYVSFPCGRMIRPGNDGMSPAYEETCIAHFKDRILESTTNFSNSL